MKTYIDKCANISTSNVEEPVSIYQNARVKGCLIGSNVVIGEHSRVDESNIENYVKIDRMNHIFKSIIRRHSYTGMNTVIMDSEIGSFCSIAWNVSIGPAEHDYKRVTNHAFLYNDFNELKPKKVTPYNRFEKKCIIGNDVWIGAGAIIQRGVNIGNGAVIASNAVVTKNVPAYAIAAGVPSSIIGYRFDKKIIEELEEIRWWDYDDNLIRRIYDLLASETTISVVNKIRKEVDEYENR